MILESFAEFISENTDATSNKINTIWVLDWGYDQTNINFYQVVGVKGKTMLVFREIDWEKGKRTNANLIYKIPKFPIRFIGEPIASKVNFLPNGNIIAKVKGTREVLIPYEEGKEYMSDALGYGR